MKELNEAINKLVDALLKNTDVASDLEKATKNPCKIHIETDKTGKMSVLMNGNGLSILVALAGAEKHIIKTTKCTKKQWELIKGVVGVGNE
ncbi:MAG: hypothetical protein J6O41_03490 [Clostridia bacterium]|nr:hypothetical protein [Clostridia bacterium]